MSKQLIHKETEFASIVRRNKHLFRYKIKDIGRKGHLKIRIAFARNDNAKKLIGGRKGVITEYMFPKSDLEYAKKLLAGYLNVNFIRENAMRVAFRKNISNLIEKKYDLIYSTGLFDYFSERVGIATVTNLRKLLNPNGVLAISTMRDKYSNPSVHYMEWAADWNLVYRNEEEFRHIFVDAGFAEDELKIQYEQQGIMQYIIAAKKDRKRQ